MEPFFSPWLGSAAERVLARALRRGLLPALRLAHGVRGALDRGHHPLVAEDGGGQHGAGLRGAGSEAVVPLLVRAVQVVGHLDVRVALQDLAAHAVQVEREALQRRARATRDLDARVAEELGLLVQHDLRAEALDRGLHEVPDASGDVLVDRHVVRSPL